MSVVDRFTLSPPGNALFYISSTKSRTKAYLSTSRRSQNAGLLQADFRRPYEVRQPRSSTIGGCTLVRMYAVSNLCNAVSMISGAPLISGLCPDPRDVLLPVLSESQ